MYYIKQKLLIIKNKNKEKRWKSQLFGKPNRLKKFHSAKEDKRSVYYLLNYSKPRSWNVMDISH